ncbi:uncharacterized protein PHACADRAFT_139272 [Phanerochaete carnosa HHB-10118-sp]|uniref:Aminotransferase class I/classII large domain-containing protein n=1 Tax=Phanerochaete carnosa (strain HHB-10118-sp) TaxID=650164 RepID=K5V5F8_PHACS|nr:uncharacterized protein PHACADRAFT_139272 [Phanerochaete carnosa HHB-10118-sp]EKM57871.1 hypothetical protein PHACADRAFT_139272 [Phanerochaete carnosa HHB-10118-sp]
MTSLHSKIAAALKSRENRLIRRRLSDPDADSGLVDFHTNDYLSLSHSEQLRHLFLQKLQTAPEVLGSGGSRLLVNGHGHTALETRLAKFFDSPAALLFNSGLDANVGFFSCIPQPGDVVVFDEYIHASVHDGVRASRAREAQFSFEHNSVSALGELLLHLLNERPSLRTGENSVFVAVESLYSMDGTIAPLAEIVELTESLFSRGNCHLVVDEAHATGVYGPQGRGMVATLGLERRVLARLHTFGKALAASGGTPARFIGFPPTTAVILTDEPIRDYLLNYARSLIYTTSLSHANIVAVGCSFDFLENGIAEKLATRLLDLSIRFIDTLQNLIERNGIPPSLLSLPPHLTAISLGRSRATPIVPVFTSQPRPLSTYLRLKSMNARPITWPTVPKGLDRVRVCLHSGNSDEEIDALARGMTEWARSEMIASQVKGGGSLGLQSKL